MTNPLERKCPTCHAAPGRPCVVPGVTCLDRRMSPGWRIPTYRSDLLGRVTVPARDEYPDADLSDDDLEEMRLDSPVEKTS